MLRFDYELLPIKNKTLSIKLRKIENRSKLILSMLDYQHKIFIIIYRKE